jgi:3-isopropylmalate/(R)-2-methylmalate dehydratase small subunit
MGIGSSREQAPLHLKLLGIRAVLAKSFARIFYRNTLNFGLPALVCADVGRINPGDRLVIDPLAGRVDNLTTGDTLTCEPLPGHLMEMIGDGGLLAHLRKKLKQED